MLRFYGRQPELASQVAWSEETDTPRHTPRGPPTESLLLRPRSLLLFCGEAYREHCHEVGAPPGGVEVLGEAAPLVNAALAQATEGDAIVRGPRRGRGGRPAPRRAATTRPLRAPRDPCGPSRARALT